MTQTIGSYSVIEYPKSVTVTDDETEKISILPDNDPSKAFDMTYAVADVLIEDLVTARPVTDLEPGNIRDGVTIAGVVGTFGPSFVDMPQFDMTPGLLEELIPEGRYAGDVKAVASDPNLIAGNIKTGETIFGVASTMPEGADINGDNGDLVLPIPTGYYGTGFVATASDTNLIAENIKTGVTIFGVASTMPAGAGTTFGADGDLDVGINAGYYDGTEKTTASDSNLVAGNLLPGVTIFGVTSNVALGVDIVGGSGVTHIPVPAGYYDGTTFVDYTP